MGKGSRDLLLKFWDPCISRNRFEPETSNLAWRLTTRGTNDNTQRDRSRDWAFKGSSTNFGNYRNLIRDTE